MMLVSITLQTKLILGVGGNSKTAYEKAGSVSVKITNKMQVTFSIKYRWLYLYMISSVVYKGKTLGERLKQLQEC